MQILINWLITLSHQVPVTWFVLFGSLIEEIIAPIPSPLVMVLAGSISAGQGSPLLSLGVLAVIGAVSKSGGSLVMYVVADKAEDVVIDTFGKFIGVSHKDTEGLGSILGQGKRDDIAIFLLRAVPLIPTAPVSVIAGLLKMNLKTYLISTFLGLTVRNLIYLYVGYTSLGALESLTQELESFEKIGYLILLGLMVGLLIWMYQKRRHGSVLTMVESMLKRFKKQTS